MTIEELIEDERNVRKAIWDRQSKTAEMQLRYAI